MSWTEQGFTLLELLIVLALMAMLAAVCFPTLDKVEEKIKLKSDARQMAWVLRSAREKAITTGQDQEVIFRVFQNYYNEDGKRYYLSPGIEFVGTTTFGKIHDRVVCIFKPSGAPSPQAGTAVLKNKYGEKISVVVNVESGRVRVEE